MFQPHLTFIQKWMVRQKIGRNLTCEHHMTYLKEHKWKTWKRKRERKKIRREREPRTFPIPSAHYHHHPPSHCFYLPPLVLATTMPVSAQVIMSVMYRWVISLANMMGSLIGWKLKELRSQGVVDLVIESFYGVDLMDWQRNEEIGSHDLSYVFNQIYIYTRIYRKKKYIYIYQKQSNFF